MPLQAVPQFSTPPPGPKVWIGELAPTLQGFTLNIPSWRFYWPGAQTGPDKVGGTIDLPSTTITFAPDPLFPKEVALYVVPTFDGADNYHLDEVILDGLHTPIAPETFPAIGPILVLWGTVPPVLSQVEGPTGEPQLFYLKHLPE